MLRRNWQPKILVEIGSQKWIGHWGHLPNPVNLSLSFHGLRRDGGTEYKAQSLLGKSSRILRSQRTSVRIKLWSKDGWKLSPTIHTPWKAGIEESKSPDETSWQTSPREDLQPKFTVPGWSKKSQKLVPPGYSAKTKIGPH